MMTVPSISRSGDRHPPGPLRSKRASGRIRLPRHSEYAQAGMALGGRVAGTAASVALTVVTARALGPTDRGIFVLAILAGYLASVVVRAASPALAYELALI